MNKQVITNFLKPKKSYSAIVEGETGTWTIIGNETMAFRQRYTPLFSDVRNEDGAAQINKLFDRFQQDAMQNVGLPTLREVKQYRKDCAGVKNLRYYLDCGSSWQDGEDDCAYHHEVTEIDLIELRDLCQVNRICHIVNFSGRKGTIFNG